MIKYVNIAAAVVLMVSSIFLVLSFGRTRAMTETLSRIEANHTPSKTAKSDSSEGDTLTYKEADSRLRKLEMRAGNLLEEQKQFHSSIQTRMSESENGADGESGAKDLNSLLERAIAKAKKERKRRARNGLEIEAILEEFDPRSREFLKMKLNRTGRGMMRWVGRFGAKGDREKKEREKIEFTKKEMDALYTHYRAFMKRRKQVVRDVLEVYKSTGEIRTEAGEKKLKAASEKFRNRARRVLAKEKWQQAKTRFQFRTTAAGASENLRLILLVTNDGIDLNERYWNPGQRGIGGNGPDRPGDNEGKGERKSGGEAK